MSTYATAPKEARDTSRIFPPLPDGMYLWLDGGKLVGINSATWCYRLERINAQRGKRYYQRWNKKRKKWYSTFRREIPLYRLRVSVSPWWDALISTASERYLRSFVEIWTWQNLKTVQEHAGRDVFGAAVHPDHGMLHEELAVTRMGTDGHWIDDTERAWGLLGPDATGVIRQVAAGFRGNLLAHYPLNSLKALYNFVAETGRVPLDVKLALDTDELCNNYFGQHPELPVVFAHYDKTWKYNSLREELNTRKALVDLLDVVKKRGAK